MARTFILSQLQGGVATEIRLEPVAAAEDQPLDTVGVPGERSSCQRRVAAQPNTRLTVIQSTAPVTRLGMKYQAIELHAGGLAGTPCPVAGTALLIWHRRSPETSAVRQELC